MITEHIYVFDMIMNISTYHNVYVYIYIRYNIYMSEHKLYV
mgnify:FL=1